jgi:hypothetical protein
VGGQGGAGGGTDPCDCEAYAPVCGEDGNTYNIGCGPTCVPIAIACEGECPCAPPARCAELETEYEMALRKAKSCSPLVPAVQCTIVANNALACPCPTHVNDQQGYGEMMGLQTEWDSLGCADQVVCTDEECPMPLSATCQMGQNDGGKCVDDF